MFLLLFLIINRVLHFQLGCDDSEDMSDGGCNESDGNLDWLESWEMWLQPKTPILVYFIVLVWCLFWTDNKRRWFGIFGFLSLDVGYLAACCSPFGSQFLLLFFSQLFVIVVDSSYYGRLTALAIFLALVSSLGFSILLQLLMSKYPTVCPSCRCFSLLFFCHDNVLYPAVMA
jgi:hypothetical protein